MYKMKKKQKFGKNKKIVIGLTGGIASGKSVVLNEFKKLGVETLDCDKIAREVVEPRQTAYKKIVKVFGKEVVKNDGWLDRTKLGEIVFHNSRKRKTLEQIVHPQVIKILYEKINRSNSNLIIVDIPLLFEAGLEKMVNKTIVVWCSKKDQFARLLKRNGMRYGDAITRIRSQWPLKKKKQFADFVINNSGSLTETKKHVKQLCFILKQEIYNQQDQKIFLNKNA